MSEPSNRKRAFYLSSEEGGVDRRAMVSLGPVSENRYCYFDCQFCYVHGPFPKYDSASPEEILTWLTANVGKFDVIYVSGDTDSFAFKRSKDAIRLLRLISENIEKLESEVLFTTRYVFTDDENEELGEIAKRIRKAGRLLIGCVSVCQLNYSELEPKPVPSPYERIDQLGVWKHLGLSTVLAIRPFIPGVDVSDLQQLATHGVRFADVIIGGHLYVDNRKIIESKLNVAIPGWRSEDHTFRDKKLDFSSSDALWREVYYTEAEAKLRNVCQQLGKPFFMRSTPAVNHIKDNREYYVGNSNQRMFAANILASVANQMTILERHSPFQDSFRGEREMGFSEFVGSNIRRYDVHPSKTTVDEVSASSGLAMIDPKSTLFQGAFKMLQEELQTLFLNLFGEDPIGGNPGVRTVLFGTPYEVGSLFGSVPSGWDALVRMKRELLSRNRTRSSRARWLASLIADVEKNLRDLVCTAIANVGASKVFRQAIIDTLEDYPATSHDPRKPYLLTEISVDFAHYMAKDADATFRVARRFFAALQPNKVSRNIKASHYMRDGLRELGGDRVQILEKLLQLRKAALHDAEYQDYFPHKKFVKDAVFDEVTEWTDERCFLVVQFLCSLCVEGALCGISSLIVDEKSLASEVAPIIRVKSNAEFRVHSLSLLQQEAYFLACFFAEACDYYLEDGESVMLKLNAAFAYQNIASGSSGRFIFSEKYVPAPARGETWHPKHTLVRCSILRQTENLRQQMLDASAEMSIEEFENWPALSFIRGTAEFHQVLAEIKSARVLGVLGTH